MGWTIRVSVLLGYRYFLFKACRHVVGPTHPYTIGTRGFIPKHKGSEPEADHSPPPSTEAKMREAIRLLSEWAERRGIRRKQIQDDLEVTRRYCKPDFLKVGSWKRCRSFREAKMRIGERGLLAVRYLYVWMKVRMATFDSDHSVTHSTHAINRCFIPVAFWFCSPVSQHNSP